MKVSRFFYKDLKRYIKDKHHNLFYSEKQMET